MLDQPPAAERRAIPNKWVLLCLAGIMLLAAWLRLGDLGLVEFKQDEATHMRLAESVLAGDLALTGSTASVGIPKPPGMTYLMAIPRAISKDPRVASGFIALLNVIAAYLCYRMGSRYWGVRAGLIAALLYAVNPWAILYARKVFTADLLPPFVALALHGLLAAIVEGKRWGWFWACIWMAALLQITFSPVALAPAFILIILVYRKRVHWPSLLAGAGAAALGFIPYLYAGWTRGFLRLWEGGGFDSGGGESAPWYAPIGHALQLASGGNLRSLAGSAADQFALGRLPGDFLDVAAQVFAALAMILLAYRAIRGQRERDAKSAAIAVLAIWAWVPLLFDLIPWTTLHPHYLVVLYPAIFLAMGWALDLALRWAEGQGAARLAILVAVALVALWQTYSISHLHSFVERHAIEGGYGLPVQTYLDAADRVRELAAELGTTEALVATDSYDTRISQAPAVLAYLLDGDLEARFVDGTAALPFAASPQPLLVWPNAGDEFAGWATRYGQERPAAALPLREREGIARLIAWPTSHPDELDRLLLTPDPGLVWTNGVELLGGRVERIAPDTLRWLIAWRANAISGADTHWFSQLVDGAGNKVAQADVVGLPTQDWRPGEVVITWFDLPLEAPLAPADYAMLVGMYTYPDLTNVTVMDIAANPAGEFISLGPIPLGQ